MPTRLRTLILLIVAACTAGLSPAPKRVVPNDNRTPAGTMVNGVLEVKLELIEALWHPQAEDGAGLMVRVIGEVGKAPMIPGPLIRVREGTEIHVSVHNALREKMAVSGLGTHPGLDKDAKQLTLAEGETGDVRFRAGAPGTYYYGAERDPIVDGKEHLDAQLAGVFIVDPPTGPIPDERIFAIGIVEEFPSAFHGWMGAFVINGKAWPYTERFTYRVGEHARWRWVNLSPFTHPMHMHGSYFTVTGVGNVDKTTVYADDAQRSVVTEPVKGGDSFSVDWVPERTGRWIFHCHLISHFEADTIPTVTYPATRSADAAPKSAAATHDHESNDPATASGGMGGLVLGITVLPGDTPPKTASAAPVNNPPARKLDLVVAKRSEPSPDGATYGFTLREGGRDLPAFDTMPSPPIVLTQHQPVDVRVVNRLDSPTAVHWHGIELDSYYDGVPGIGGEGRQVTPSIAPGGSFNARFAPPRAGTFIYHTHWHDVSQLVGGLYGPLIVLPPGQKFDPETDKIFLITASADGDYSPLLINGTRNPSPMTMKVGTKYRLRFINIGANSLNGGSVTVRDETRTVTWRGIAKDGADLPESQQHTSLATQQVLVGETYDFEFTPQKSGRLRFEFWQKRNVTELVLNVDVR